jgi:hypothetical protein
MYLQFSNKMNFIVQCIVAIIATLAIIVTSNVNSRLFSIPGLNTFGDVTLTDAEMASLPKVSGLNINQQQAPADVFDIPGLDLTLTTQTNANVTYLLAMERPKKFGELTLHGLWPNNSGVRRDEKFDAKKLEPIRADLDKYWYSYKAKTAEANEIFWDHEWSKHGVEFGTGQLEYFDKTLHLLGEIGFYHCDQPQFCDCRCKLDANFKLMAPCVQKGDVPPV